MPFFQRRRSATDRVAGGTFPRAELDALHETAVLVADRHEMPELLRLILTRAAALVGVEDAFLYLLQPDGKTLVVVAGLGEFAEQHRLLGSGSERGSQGASHRRESR